MAMFLEKPDYSTSINIAVIDAMTAGDDAILNELTMEAVEEMKSYLNSRYEVQPIFDAGGDERNKTIAMYCKDIALYHLYSINSLSSIPETRVNRYNKALSWLQDVSDQKINPEGLPLNSKSFVKTGGNEKRINHQQ